MMRRIFPVVIVFLLASLCLAVGSCGGEPIPPESARSDDGGAQAVEIDSEATEKPPPPVHVEATSTKAGGKRKARQRFTLRVQPKAPDDGTTNLVVYLAGTVPADVRLYRPFLEVCGLHATYEDDGSFVVRRSFPRAGTYSVLARLLRVGNREVLHTTTSKIELKHDPGEAAFLENRALQALGPSGVVHDAAWMDLIRSADLRTAPYLWKFINAHPGSDNFDRHFAILALGLMGHLDSVPDLVKLLDDKVDAEWARYSLRRFGFYNEEFGGFMTMEFQPGPPGSLKPSSEAEKNQRIKAHLGEWRRREPRIRKLLHQ